MLLINSTVPEGCAHAALHSTQQASDTCIMQHSLLLLYLALSPFDAPHALLCPECTGLTEVDPIKNRQRRPALKVQMFAMHSSDAASCTLTFALALLKSRGR